VADEKQLAILRRGVEEWNAWREANPTARIDLVGADFADAKLPKVNLRRANLALSRFEGADLRRAILLDATLDGALFDKANLERSVFTGSELGGAELPGTTLVEFQSPSFSHANLRTAQLNAVRIIGAVFDKADCSGAVFTGSTLAYAEFRGADLSKASFGATIFAGINLSDCRGLEITAHHTSSSLSIDTLRLSKGKIPEHFLRGCGLSDVEIKLAKLFDPSLAQSRITDLLYSIDVLRGTAPIQKHNVFISYSHADAPFVEALEKRFDAKGIRYWRDVHDMTAGPLEQQIDRAIRLHPVVLLVLSERSVDSDWVQWEASRARQLEKSEERPVLCPVALDDAWKHSRWPGPLRQQIETYHILDLSNWSDDSFFDRQFKKLLDGLGVFYPAS
jgi:uncharacterized protein YjbI with pentapeptide repeats